MCKVRSSLFTKMATNDNFEEEFKTMKRHFGGIVSLVKDLKARLESLELEVQPDKDQEVKDIAEKQAKLDELFVVKKESIIRIDKEMEEMKNSGFGSQSSRGNHTEEVKGASEKGIVKNVDTMTKDTASTRQSVDTITQRKCAGLTKKARDVKTGVVEEDILEPVNGFKEMLGVEGLTVTICMLKSRQNLQKECKQFKCAGCIDIWEDKNCVVKHQLENGEVYFCLNCDDWIVNKS